METHRLFRVARILTILVGAAAVRNACGQVYEVVRALNGENARASRGEQQQ